MNIEHIVRNGPGIYHAGRGVLADLSTLVEPFQQIAVITGERSYAAFERFHGTQNMWPVYRYDRTASRENMRALSDEIATADLIVAIGGGKVLDTAKGVAEYLNADIAFVPTVAGTCACATPVAAIYHPNHTFREIGYFRRSGYLCLVDYDLLLTSPREYLLGGISDTLAKWYEIEALTRNFQQMPAMVAAARATAAVTRDILIKDTNTALHAHSSGCWDEAFANIIDAVFMIAATVGCFGCDDGRTAGAHAIHNALTIYPETHAIQHGIKVAYGILVQLVTTGDEDEIRHLLPYYQSSGFIYRFAQLGIKEDIHIAAPKLAAFAADKTQSFCLIRPITAEEITQAILRLEMITDI